MERRRFIWETIAAASTTLIGGCAGSRWIPAESVVTPPTVFENPFFIPVANHEFLWTVVVDTVDDYFDIAYEQQVREIGGVLMEGWIESKPLAGATLIEPLRKDSTS